MACIWGFWVFSTLHCLDDEDRDCLQENVKKHYSQVIKLWAGLKISQADFVLHILGQALHFLSAQTC